MTQRLPRTIARTLSQIFALLAVTTGPAPGQAVPSFGDSMLAIGGTRLHYQVAGSGPAVVLIHGFGEVLAAEAISPLLLPTHEVIRFDVPGFGTSNWSGPPDRVGEVVASDIIALLDRLHVQRADFVGTSMGSLLATRFAVLHPDRVRSLTLFEPMPMARGTLGPLLDSSVAGLERGTMLNMINALQPAGEHQFTPTEIANTDRASFATHDAHVWAAMARSFRDQQLAPAEFRILQMPIIAFSGEIDPLHAGFIQSQQEYPHLQVISLPGKGHGGMVRLLEMRQRAVGFIDSVETAHPR